MPRFIDSIFVKGDANPLEAQIVATILDDYISLPRRMKIGIDKAPQGTDEVTMGTCTFDPIDRPDVFKILFQKGTHPHFTIAHELGHVYDVAVNQIPNRINYRPEFESWRKAVQGSPEYGRLILDLETATNAVTREFYVYVLSWEECWARCFAQFFAELRPQSALGREFADYKTRKKRQLLRWDEESFLPIADAMLQLFKTVGTLSNPIVLPDHLQ